MTNPADIARALSEFWQPIETAPRDGSEFLAYSEPGGTDVMLVRHIALCEFLTDAEVDEYLRQGMSVEDLETADWFAADFLHGERLSQDCYPTHWMPLPEFHRPTANDASTDRTPATVDGCGRKVEP